MSQKLQQKEFKNKSKFRSSFERFFTKGRANRSISGTIGLMVFICLFAAFSLFPVLFMIGNAFKPMSELFKYPPTMLPVNPTTTNFSQLFEFANSSLVPFTRYLFNTGVIVLIGCVGNIVLSAMAAFPLAKFKFPGRDLLSQLVVYALMFSAAVTAVPNYIVMSYFGLVDSIWAVILPSMASTLGLYLLKNFMLLVPDSLIEAAKIDGSTKFKCLFQVVLPVVKPAWITVFIFSFQALWGNTGGSFIYSENLKPLSYMLTQIASAGISRQGLVAAASLFMFCIPVIIFIISQSKVLETMATSGMKD